MYICPCGSAKSLGACCGPYIKGELIPETAESLMRARYTSYTLCNVDFVYSTHHPDTRSEVSKKLIEEWSKSSQWSGLTVLGTKYGSKSDSYGIVEFKAFYSSEGKECIHHEISKFVKKDGVWYYEGWLDPDSSSQKKDGKIGRNSICPCGSDKKYKKCCGK